VKATGTGGGHVWTFHEPPLAPYRHYRCDGLTETLSGLHIVSVTQVLGTLSKDNLVPWAANTDIEACFTLARRGTPYRRCPSCNGVTLAAVCDKVIKGKKGKKGRKTLPDEPDQPDFVCGADTERYRLPFHWRQLQADIKSAGLEHDVKRDEAAFRGTSIHALHEEWVNEHHVPVAADYRAEWAGYIQAYAKWLLMMTKRGATFESVEQIVGSTEYGFAGSCDTVAIVAGKDGKRERWDFKTSKQVYARTNFRQLAGYELADVEMGNEPTDEQWIAVLRADGEFIPAKSTATAKDFLNVLAVFRDDQPFIKIDDAAYRARRKEDA
jgi:hypothetical protein